MRACPLPADDSTPFMTRTCVSNSVNQVPAMAAWAGSDNGTAHTRQARPTKRRIMLSRARDDEQMRGRPIRSRDPGAGHTFRANPGGSMRVRVAVLLAVLVPHALCLAALRAI